MGEKKFISLLLISYLTMNNLSDFQTDGCTLFAEGTFNRPKLWQHCCVEHDLRYWFGGSMVDQLKSDQRLKSCVEKVAGKNWAQLIYTGVRAGHLSPLKSKYQWSWGWLKERPNSELGALEKDYVISELWRLPYDQVFIEHFISDNF